jgi:serine/threonine-protein kinase RsbT
MISTEGGEVIIRAEIDIVSVRRSVREAALRMGFGPTDVTRIVTAASELARNVFNYAGSGQMTWRWLQEAGRDGLELSFIDQGPGIVDVEAALTPGHTTSRGLGMGLPGSRRLMGELELTSKPGEGTVVTVRKWKGA